MSATTVRRSYVKMVPFTVVDHLPADAVPATLGPTRTSSSAQEQKLTKGSRLTLGRLQNLLHVSHCIFLSCCDTLFYRMEEPSAWLMFYSPLDLQYGTDGGALAGIGTFRLVWVAARQLLAEGCCQVLGRSYIMSSTGTELCGFLAAITYLRLVIEYHAMSNTSWLALLFVTVKQH